MKTTPSGFSLIELMIVIAIVGVTASVAVPAYQNYLGRSKVSEAFQMVGPYQKAIAECYSTLGAMSACNSNSNGIPESATGTYGSLTATNGNIVFTFNASAKPVPAGSTFTLIPRVTNSNNPVIWDCSATLDRSYLPSTCSESAAPAVSPSPSASPAASPTPTGTITAVCWGSGTSTTLTYNASVNGYVCPDSGGMDCPSGYTRRSTGDPSYIAYCRQN